MARIIHYARPKGTDLPKNEEAALGRAASDVLTGRCEDRTLDLLATSRRVTTTLRPPRRTAILPDAVAKRERVMTRPSPGLHRLCRKCCRCARRARAVDRAPPSPRELNLRDVCFASMNRSPCRHASQCSCTGRRCAQGCALSQMRYVLRWIVVGQRSWP